MSHLDAKALDTDPAGMAFLARVLASSGAAARRPDPHAFAPASFPKARPAAVSGRAEACRTGGGTPSPALVE